jgi:hypothetical protein
VACVDCPAAWMDSLVMYLNCSTLFVDGPNCLFGICADRDGSGAGLGNSVLQTGPTVVGPDGSRSRGDGPTMCRLADLPLICIGGCGCPSYVSIDIP